MVKPELATFEDEAVLGVDPPERNLWFTYPVSEYSEFYDGPVHAEEEEGKVVSLCINVRFDGRYPLLSSKQRSGFLTIAKTVDVNGDGSELIDCDRDAIVLNEDEYRKAINGLLEVYFKHRLESMKKEQLKPNPPACPRCGGAMNPNGAARNALSRQADVFVCDTCGRVEAIRAMKGQTKPFRFWKACRTM